jgi:hypothetical protein
MSISGEKYWFEGDTLIDNRRYTKVYKQFCKTETDCEDLQYYAAVREDTIAEKIYCIQTLDGVERLLADFDVQKGDEVTVCSFWNKWVAEEQSVIVKHVDSVWIDNQYRKRIIIDYQGFGHIPEEWVEGLGSIVNGLFFPCTSPVADAGMEPVFLCLQIDDVLIYQNAMYNTCYLYYGGGGIPENKYSKFRIYPTVVDDKLYVEKKEDSCFYKITNNQGIIVQSGTFSGEYIQVSNFVQGIYYITFYNNSLVYSNKFIKR